jgi:gliding motility-associated-like protein
VAWAIGVNNDTLKVEKDDRYACSESEIVFSAEEGWDKISWTSQLKGNLGTSATVRYSVEAADSVIATLSNSEGCKIIRKTAIKLSKPDLIVPADHYKIIKGSDVQLDAEGAQRYRWTPKTGLSNDTIPNPIASPSATIKYAVTGYDSLGCFSTIAVDITVEETGFIPSLFSPNDDDQNDQLKIYGIVSAQRFSLNIFDRDGALVYKTSDLNEAVQRGWDGTKNGTKQPPGVYFWKVTGELSSGPLLLNGKDAGSVVLIR